VNYCFEEHKKSAKHTNNLDDLINKRGIWEDHPNEQQRQKNEVFRQYVVNTLENYWDENFTEEDFYKLLKSLYT